MSSLDLQKVKPLPIQKTILLLNNFILNTTKFLNAFSETCESRISFVSSKATELEILLAVLEAKLNSIPDLEYTAPPAAAAQPQMESSGPVPAATPSANPPQTAAAAAADIPSSGDSAGAAGGAASGVQAKNHPDYEVNRAVYWKAYLWYDMIYM